jgi:uncharacterized membrane protein YqjE
MADTPRPRLAASLRGLIGTGLEAAHTRLKLLAVEIEEEKLRLTALVMNTVLCALLLGFGLVFLAVFVTVLLWDEHRLLALGLATLVFLGGAVFTATNAARELRRGSRLFEASLAELRRDRDAVLRE